MGTDTAHATGRTDARSALEPKVFTGCDLDSRWFVSIHLDSPADENGWTAVEIRRHFTPDEARDLARVLIDRAAMAEQCAREHKGSV